MGTYQPSRQTIQKSIELGRLMAATERRLRPDLSNAYQNLSYLQFIQSHRYRLEISKLFERWDNYIHRLIEREEVVLDQDLHDSELWEEIHNRIAMPIRCGFWYGWEEAVGLKRMFDRQVEIATTRRVQLSVVQVADAREFPALAEVQDTRPEGHDPTGAITIAVEGILDDLNAKESDGDFTPNSVLPTQGSVASTVWKAAS